MNYYVSEVLKVLQGEPLNAHDKYSFDYPPILSQADWKKLLDKKWTDAENFAGLIEQLPESKLWEDFSDKKYGNYYQIFKELLNIFITIWGKLYWLKKYSCRQIKI